MHILPILSLAETAVDTLSNLFSGSGEERGFSDIYRRYQAHAEKGDRDSSALSLQERAEAAGRGGDARRREYENFASGITSYNENPAMQAAQDIDSEDFSKREEQRYTPLEQAPHTAHSTDGVLYEVGEVGFTQQELSELRDSLLKEGLPPESLTVLEQLASHPHGATLGQLLSLLHGSVLNKPSLSDDDKLNLQTFADKIDNTGNLGKQMLGLLENGQSLAAWNTLREAMAGIDHLTLLVEDVTALGKAFGLGKDTLGKLLAQFGDSSGLLLSPDLFNTLMVPVQQDLQNRDGGKEKLSKILESRLKPLIAKARSRAESERKAAGKADRRTEQSEIMIRDRFMKKFHTEIAGVEKDELRSNGEIAGTGKDTARLGSSDKKDVSAELAGLKPEDIPALKKSASPQDMSDRAELGEWQKNLRRVREDNPLGNNARDSGARRDHAQESMFSRIEVRQNERAQAPAFSPALGAQFAAQGRSNAGAQGAAQANAPDPLAGRALQQVEQGFVSALNNGGRKLELQLTPGELGGVTLILTSGKGGEVSALIRSEKPETTELMARHLDVIRTNLEQQGIKVDKLEVQNQSLSNQEQQQWQGMEQHNAMREEQEHRDNLERLRRLGRLVDGDAAPAQDVQNTLHPAEISGHGLHLVA